MTLTQAAELMEKSPAYLAKLVAERNKPRSKRRYSDALHEHYMTRHFFKDTKGHRDPGPGRFEWHIADERVQQFARRRAIRLSGRDTARDGRSVNAMLAEVGLS